MGITFILAGKNKRGKNEKKHDEFTIRNRKGGEVGRRKEKISINQNQKYENGNNLLYMTNCNTCKGID